MVLGKLNITHLLGAQQTCCPHWILVLKKTATCADSYTYTGVGFLSECSLGYVSIPSHHQMGAPNRAPSTTSLGVEFLGDGSGVVGGLGLGNFTLGIEWGQKSIQYGLKKRG